MAFCNKPEEQNQLSLQISNLSELNNYDKIRVLGSGGFAKVYLVRYRKETDSMNTMKCAHSIDSKNKLNNVIPGTEFAAKMQGFVGGPSLNRREASILKRLVNSEVFHRINPRSIDLFEGLIIEFSFSIN